MHLTWSLTLILQLFIKQVISKWNRVLFVKLRFVILFPLIIIFFSLLKQKKKIVFIIQEKSVTIQDTFCKHIYIQLRKGNSFFINKKKKLYENKFYVSLEFQFYSRIIILIIKKFLFSLYIEKYLLFYR